jgi:hypothetical protein
MQFPKRFTQAVIAQLLTGSYTYLCIYLRIYLFICCWFNTYRRVGQSLYWLAHELDNLGFSSRQRQDNIFFSKISK